ncbi:MAG: electron transport complex subunit E [Defluviitoga tunisiensis]|jgi:electron transport complex protein RnfE|nr:electron transport complex subunit E [Defluviitoga tunisiensis]MDD3600277.1 electron transport complex subunit E [Defluviitoga tunisiensis]MDY0379109.1 electron transport complex subunit E [Defluviitoga tunisiensis]HHV00746.1 electron transport complex subunit E [Defluviitoga tunisiensis]HOB54958.1 electron transport complex subunit E [Defluviitoga tunisiensis]HOK15920.1 electron transport complex subunit E [Defluviitoga tunisiensis]
MADIKNFTNGLIKNNPTFVQVLGICPTLATTTSAKNALGMGVATLFALILSNIVISLIRKIVPENVRIPIYIVVIASFVTVIDLLMHGFLPELWESLGIFIPLIVVNCIIMGRAEAFASKNGVIDSIFDALGNGLGFTGSLFLIGTVRELIGNGSILGINIFGNSFKVPLLVLAPGAFLTLGLLLAMFNSIGNSKKNKQKKVGANK